MEDKKVPILEELTPIKEEFNKEHLPNLPEQEVDSFIVKLFQHISSPVWLTIVSILLILFSLVYFGSFFFPAFWDNATLSAFLFRARIETVAAVIITHFITRRKKD